MRLKDSKESETFERKRTRSSLDVKVSNGENLTRPPPGQKPPTPQFDFSELDGMSEDEIMQALYDDPELAAAAAAAAEKLQNDPKPRTRRTLSDYPDHLRAMMDEGVPIFQWIILLVLLGAGMYQLRKALVGSKKVAKAVKADKTPRKGKQKEKKKHAAVKSRSSQAIKSSPKQEELLQDVPVASPKKGPKNKKKVRNKPKNKPEITSGPTAKKEENDAVSHESPDSISTDGSSSTTGVAQHEDQAASETVVENGHSHKEPPVEDGDGWHIVGTPTAESKADHKKTEVKIQPQLQVEPVNEPETKPLVEKSPQVAEPEVAEPEVAKHEVAEPENEAPKVNGNKELTAPSKAIEVQVSKSAKKTKAKKKSPAKKELEVVIPDDETLAMQLQLQEEKIAEHEASKAQETDDVWEEVTNKKKKRAA